MSQITPESVAPMAPMATSPPKDVDSKVEPKPTLTPPASEEADRLDDSGSELSELELEPEEKPAEDGEIEPDHYYEGGKIPVFKPVCIIRVQHTQGIPAARPWYRQRTLFPCGKPAKCL